MESENSFDQEPKDNYTQREYDASSTRFASNSTLHTASPLLSTISIDSEKTLEMPATPIKPWAHRRTVSFDDAAMLRPVKQMADAAETAALTFKTPQKSKTLPTTSKALVPPRPSTPTCASFGRKRLKHAPPPFQFSPKRLWKKLKKSHSSVNVACVEDDEVDDSKDELLPPDELVSSPTRPAPALHMTAPRTPSPQRRIQRVPRANLLTDISYPLSVAQGHQTPTSGRLSPPKRMSPTQRCWSAPVPMLQSYSSPTMPKSRSLSQTPSPSSSSPALLASIPEERLFVRTMSLPAYLLPVVQSNGLELGQMTTAPGVVATVPQRFALRTTETGPSLSSSRPLASRPSLDKTRPAESPSQSDEEEDCASTSYSDCGQSTHITPKQEMVPEELAALAATEGSASDGAEAVTTQTLLVMTVLLNLGVLSLVLATCFLALFRVPGVVVRVMYSRLQARGRRVGST